jgi:hypothetical protein
MDLAVVHRIFHPTSTQYTFFSAAHGTFSKIDPILGHKASLSKDKIIEIIPYILFGHNTLKLELNNKNNSRKYVNNWKLNNTLLNDQRVIVGSQQMYQISCGFEFGTAPNHRRSKHSYAQ